MIATRRSNASWLVVRNAKWPIPATFAAVSFNV
jgi:hypothetical protein